MSDNTMLLSKFNPLKNDVIFIDGMWGTGKSVLAPIISGMSGVEKFRLDPAFEYACVLEDLGKIEPDAAETLLLIYADMDQYHNLLSREVNLRWSDDSGAGNNPRALTYIRRLFRAGGDEIVEEINAGNLALHIMSHAILPVAAPLFRTYGRRLKLVEMVRHPLYQVSHSHAYLSRFEGPREFTVSFDRRGVKVPWFAQHWADEYASLSVMDRTLATIVRLHERLLAMIDEHSGKGSLLVTTFEDAAFYPRKILDQLSKFLGRTHHSRVDRILRKQRLPREQISHGKGHAAYGWKKGTEATEREAYDAQLSFVLKHGTDPYITPFKGLIADYNRRWPSILAEFDR